jgi:excisionase family DNA binding protein
VEEETAMLHKLLNAKEATEILGISRSSLYKLVRQGEVQAIRFGKSVRFLPEDIEAYIQKSKVNTTNGLLGI